MSKVKKILIVMCGMPGSGKTTTSTELKRAFNDQFGIKCTYINRDTIATNMGYDRLELQVEQSRKVLSEAYSRLDHWALDEDTNPVCIWDNTDINYFKRKDLLDKMDPHRNEDPVNDKFIICAIHMNRSISFCKDNNRNRKHTIPDLAMQRMYRNQQQPVYDEGFDIIFHVDGHKRIAISPFFLKLAKFADLDKLGNKGE